MHSAYIYCRHGVVYTDHKKVTFMKAIRDKRAGFTLTEVMVASGVLVLFLAAFFSAFIIGIQALDLSVNHYRANAIARNRIQRARSFDYSSLTLLEEIDTRIDHHGNLDINGGFRRTTRINTNTVSAPHTVIIEVGVRFPIRSTGRLSEPLMMDNIIAVRM